MKMKRFVSAALTLMLAATMGICAAAEEEPTRAPSGAGEAVVTYEDLAKVGISKTLVVANGINIDGVRDFDFSFTNVNGSGTKANADLNRDVTVTVGNQSNGYAVGNKTFADIFGDPNNFGHAGEYVFEVTETTEGYADKAETTSKIETLTVDQSVYTVRVYVVNTDDGLGYQGITVEKGGEKVDPTIIIEEIPGNPDTLVGTSGANFINTYTEKLITDDNGNGVLTVKKIITGDYGDKSKPFDVSVKFTIPTTATQDDVEVEGGTNNSARDIQWESDYIGIVHANLADGGTITFKKLPVGTTYIVSETQDYTYKSKITGAVETQDTEYVAGHRSVPGAGPIQNGNLLVTIENNKVGIVPTGLFIDNLPYIAIVAVALGGLIFFIVKKTSRSGE